MRRRQDIPTLEGLNHCSHSETPSTKKGHFLSDLVRGTPAATTAADNDGSAVLLSFGFDLLCCSIACVMMNLFSGTSLRRGCTCFFAAMRRCPGLAKYRRKPWHPQPRSRPYGLSEFAVRCLASEAHVGSHWCCCSTACVHPSTAHRLDTMNGLASS